MGKTLCQLKREMHYREFVDWCHYYNQHPFGEGAADMRHGIQTANIVAPHLEKGKTANPYDYMVTEKEPKKKASIKGQIAQMKRFAAATQKRFSK